MRISAGFVNLGAGSRAVAGGGVIPAGFAGKRLF
jgi:hypothetical protein